MQKMVKRKIANDLQRLASTYKVLTILGPRQAGKSTLAKAKATSLSLVDKYNYRKTKRWVS